MSMPERTLFLAKLPTHLVRTLLALALASTARTSASSIGAQQVEIDWPALGQGFIEERFPDESAGSFEEALVVGFARLDLGAVRVYCPPERLADRKWLALLAPAYVGICEMQAEFGSWTRGADPVSEAAREDLQRIAGWIDGWQAKQFKKLAAAESLDLAVFLEPPEEVAQSLARQRAAWARGGELGLRLLGAERVDIVLAPTRLDFLQTVAFLGRDDTDFRADNWLPGVDQWTQVWRGSQLVLAAEYAPWSGFDPKFKQRKPIQDVEEDGIAQLVTQQTAGALLTLDSGTQQPLFEKRGVANVLTISARGALNVIDSERGMSTSGAKTEPYERFVPGGNSEGGVLPVVPAAPFDTIVESPWRKGHGADFFVEPLQKGQSAGAKAAKKQKHARAKDTLAHFVLQSETQQKHTVSAPFLGPHANDQPYPPFAFLHDFREFFTAYQTAFVNWMRTASDADPAVCSANFARYLEALQTAPNAEALYPRIEQIYGLPLSAADGDSDSLEWRFLAWLAAQ